MPLVRQLHSQLQQVKALEIITGAFSEISALKITKLKQAFEQNSLYYEEISQIYNLLKRSYKKKIIQSRNNKKKISPLPSLPTNGKDLYVAITSNHGFYGALNSDAVNQMAKDVSSKKADRMIIGSVGISYAKNTHKLSPFTPVVFTKDEPSKDEVASFLEKTRMYKRIFVYFPKFISMFTQKIDSIDITYSPEPTVLQSTPIDYIFEPELPKILSFFDHQIRFILFLRVLLETNLSRTATRLISMDQAERRAQNLVKKLHAEISKMRKTAINAQLIASSGQLKKWRRHHT